MSKQEKLAALIQATRNQHFGDHGTWNDLVRAISDYDSTPDDPPPRPEMPECVAKLVDWARTLGGPYTLPGGLVDKIRDHYAQPLKLEVGKVYEDGHEGPVQIVWKSPSRNGYRWLGVVVTNGETRWFNDDGKPPCQTPEFKLIREVRQ